jgi:hypothetical protein
VAIDHVRSVWTALRIVLASLSGVPAQSQEAGQPRGEKYALLVGVRQYDPNELRPLAYSEPDVVELAEVLKDAGYSRVVLVTQTEGAADVQSAPRPEANFGEWPQVADRFDRQIAGNQRQWA